MDDGDTPDNELVTIYISRDEQKNSQFLENYLEGYNNKEDLAYQKSFVDYVKQCLAIDDPSYKEKTIKIRIDNYWPPEEKGDDHAITKVLKKIKGNTIDKYWGFDKTHIACAFSGGNFDDCIFVDRFKDAKGEDKKYEELLNTGRYGFCQKNADGSNDRFKCQRIGASLLMAVVAGGASLATPLGTSYIGIGGASALGALLEDIALNQYKESFYAKGYIDSYIGDKLAELGAVALATGVAGLDGAVTSLPLAAMLCATAGMANNIPAKLVVGGSAVYEAYDGLNKALSDLNSYNESAGEGKRPEDIYNNSKQKFKKDVDQLWPTYSKVGCAIICGILGFGMGATIPMIGAGIMATTLAISAGSAVGVVSGYIYEKEILDVVGKAKDWIAEKVLNIVPEYKKQNIDEEELTDHIKVSLKQIKENEMLLGISSTLEEGNLKKYDVVNQKAQKDEGYDPVDAELFGNDYKFKPDPKMSQNQHQSKLKESRENSEIRLGK
jgi:hypothetical protein